MNKLLILVVIAMFLLSGCGSDEVSDTTVKTVDKSPETAPVADEMPETTETATAAPVPEPTASPVVEETEPATTQQMNPKVQALLDKTDSIKSYEFFYQTSDNWDLIRDKYYIRDNIVKIKLFEVNWYNKKAYFDTVYLDMDAETAVAFCEDTSHSRCEDSDKEFVIEYNDFKLKTPKEWVNEIEYAEWVGTEQLDKRSADIVEYDNNDGTTTRIWIDSYSGLARQIWIYRGDTENLLDKYGFRDLAINSVKADDVKHTFA